MYQVQKAMFGLQPQEIIIILLIFVVFFGYKKLPAIATGFAKGIKNFKKGMKEPLDELNSDSEDDKE